MGGLSARGTFPGVNTLHALTDWLARVGRFLPSLEALLDGWSLQLRANGIPVDRVLGLLVTLHPQIRAVNFYWRDGVSEVVDRLHGEERSPGFLASPGYAVVYAGTDVIRRRLLDGPDDFPVLGDLRGQGFTDYLMMGLEFSDRSRHAISYATRAPEGFSDEQIQALLALEAPLSTLLELLRQRSIAATLLRTYVGPRTGEEVLHGHIRRGDRRELDAVVMLADMRDFTALTAALPRAALLARLDAFFGVGVAAVHERGGEVLKFIGDALLAVFPAGDGAAKVALEASEALLAGLDPETRVGVALHRGEVTYGNVGGPDRLDFTVIGPAVNATARMADLCKVLGEDLLISQGVAAELDRPLRPLGLHALRGLPEPFALYALG